MLKRLSQRLSQGSGEKMRRQPSTRQEEFNQLSSEAMSYFNAVAKKPFSEQAIAFLDVYWTELQDQAPFIFEMAWETIKMADMRAQGVSYIHLYDEGASLDFNIALYFYEQLCKRVLEDDAGKKWRDDPVFKPSMPSMMTAIVRKQTLREIDLNFDNSVSFIEYLLYQYRDVTGMNPAEFTRRGMASADESEEMQQARYALDEVNESIRAYEEKKRTLTEQSKGSGVRGLAAKHQLTMLVTSPVAEQLSTALIKAEAKLRIAVRAHRRGMSPTDEAPNSGSMWWLQKDLEMKKKLYGTRRM